MWGPGEVGAQGIGIAGMCDPRHMGSGGGGGEGPHGCRLLGRWAHRDMRPLEFGAVGIEGLGEAGSQGWGTPGM